MSHIIVYPQHHRAEHPTWAIRTRMHMQVQTVSATGEARSTGRSVVRDTCRLQ
jgi:hypothetical protein